MFRRTLPAMAVVALVGASVLWPAATPALAAGVPATVSSYTVPAGVTAVSITAWGAAGTAPSGGTAGTGGGITSVISVTPGQILQLSTGQVGGGADAGAGGNWGNAGAGGGASDVRTGACAATLSCGVADRVVVAGAGGGAGGSSGNNPYPVMCGGDGGAATDGSGSEGCTRNAGGLTWPHGGYPGTPTAAGAGGQASGSYGGTAGSAASGAEGGAGGAGSGSAGGGGGQGYFGAGGGAGWSGSSVNIPGGGGGGGSSWAKSTALSTRFLGAGNNGAGSIAVTALTTDTPSTTTVALSPASQQASDAFTITATVAPAASSGTVTFFSNNAVISGCSAVAVSAGLAHCTSSYATVGARTIVAIFSGTSSIEPSTSPSQTLTITQKATTSSLISNRSPGNVGTSITYTAQVSPVPTGGSFTFSSDGSAIGSCTNVGYDGTGKASCTLTYAVSGTRAIGATYSGNTDYATSAAPVLNQSVIGASTTTTVVSDGNPNGLGAGVTYTATVSPVPTAGTITFTDGGSTISGCAAVTVNTSTGKAQCNVSYPTAGTHEIVASYNGSTDYAASDSAAITQTINSGAATHGAGVHLYTVPSGVTAISVTAWGAAGSAPSGSAGGTGGGVTSVISVTPGQILQLNSGAVGGGGDAGSGGNWGNAGAGGGASDVRVGACAATLSCGTADRVMVAGGGGGAGGASGGNPYPVMCGGAGGSGTDGSGSEGCTRSAGGLTWPHGGYGATRTAVGAGGQASVSYGGTAGLAGVSATGGAGGVGSGSAGGGGGSGYFGGGGGAGWSGSSVNIPGGGGGGGSSWGATSTLSTRFLGSSNSGAGSVSVTPLTASTSTSTSLVLTPTTSQASLSVTFTATVSPSTSTGTVTFFSNTAVISGCENVAVSAGVASCTTSYATVGARTIDSIYSGTSTLLPSTSNSATETITQKSTTTTLTSSAASIPATENVTYTATVSPVPTGGTITFSRGGASIAACTNVTVNTSTGVASCTESYSTSGDRVIQAMFSGNADYSLSGSSNLTQVVTGTTTATTIVSPLNPSAIGQSLTYTATVTPVPNAGTVAFKDGSTAIVGCGAVTVNTTTGKAQCQTSYATTGARSITAVYAGVADYGTSTSGVLTQNVAAQTASFAPGVESFTVPNGWSSITVTAWGAAGAAPSGSTPGTGGGVKSVIAVTHGQVIQINTGAVGGGGPAGAGGNWGNAGGGGGASDIRVGACAATLSCTAADRVVVAAGGGGAGGASGGNPYPVMCGGAGGSNADGSGAEGCTRSAGGLTWPHGGYAATSTAAGAGGQASVSYGGTAGSAGSGANGGAGGVGSGSAGGGGGGGYFGGGGGAGWSGSSVNIPGGGGGGGSSWGSSANVSTAFLGSSNTGAGSVTISHTATQLAVTQAVSGPIVYGTTRVITATLRDSGGNVVDSGPFATAVVTFAKTSGSGAVTGLTSVSAVGGVATITVTGSTVGSLGVTATTTDFTSTELALSVSKADQTISFTQPSSPRVYGSTFSVSPTATSGLGVTTVASGGCSISGSTVTMTSGTTACTLTATQAGNGSFNSAPDVTRSVAASASSQAALVAAGSTAVEYGSSVTLSISGGSGTGAVTFAESSASCSLTDATVASVSVIATAGSGSCTVTAVKAGDSNYSAQSVDREFSTSRKALSVDALAATKVYGSADPALTSAFNGFVFADTASNSGITGSAVCSREAGSAASTYEISCAVGSLAATNYSFSAGAPAVFTISKKSLTITASDATITHGDATPIITAAYDGLTNGDLGLATAAECSTTVNASSDAGAHASTCENAADPNYDISYVDGEVTVLMATQSIDFEQPASPATYGGTFDVAPTASSGLPVTVTASGGCSISAGTVTMLSGSTDCSLVASQPGDGNFFAAPSIERVVSPTKATQADLELTAPVSAIYGDSAVVTLSQGGSGTGAVTFEIADAAVCELDATDGSSATIVMTAGVGVCSVTATKAGDANFVAASSAIDVSAAKRVLSVDAVDASKVYGDADPTLEFDLAGFINGEGFTSVSGAADCSREAGDDAGMVAITCAPGSLTAADYSFATGASADFTISKRALTITASDAQVSFGDSTPTISPIYVGLANGDLAPTVVPSCSTEVTTTTPAGEYASVCADASDPNYTIAFVDGVVRVVAAVQTISLDQPTSAVFGSAFIIAPTASSTLEVIVVASGGCSIEKTGDHYTVSMTSGSTDCRLTATQAGTSNFEPASARVTVSATKAPLVVDAADSSKIAGQADGAFNWSLAGFVAGDTVSTASISGAPDCRRDAGEAVGAYGITCRSGSLSAPDYSFATGEGATFTISAGPSSDGDGATQPVDGTDDGDDGASSDGDGEADGSDGDAIDEPGTDDGGTEGEDTDGGTADGGTNGGSGSAPSATADEFPLPLLVLGIAGGVVAIGGAATALYFIRRRVIA